MILAVCIDDHNGLSFNSRRVSSDKAVIQDIVKVADTQIIMITPYSAPLFQDFQGRIEVKKNIFESSAVCFAEAGDFLSVIDDVEKLIVYKWNRRYPSDQKFPLDAFKACMRLENTEDIPGSSHPCITREVYIR